MNSQVWVACSENGYPANNFGGYVVHEDRRVVEMMAAQIGGRAIQYPFHQAEKLTPRRFPVS